MNYIVSASTDIGIRKDTNQDSLTVKVLNTKQGKMVFAVLCDGMGGLSKGEVASSTLIRAFNRWALEDLKLLCNEPLDDETICNNWETIIVNENKKIMNYGKQNGVSLGTTAVALLLTQTKYYILNVGDSRVYDVSDSLYQLTKDQTVVAQEIELGKITAEQAKTDPRRNVLLQCIGASDVVCPEIFCGETKQNAVYMLCSDGFRHEISPEEIYNSFEPNQMLDANMMEEHTKELIELNKSRQEQDNISVITIRTF